jgi:ubiquinone/menaquinone biosynthesis C-methylase UbiE
MPDERLERYVVPAYHRARTFYHADAAYQPARAAFYAEVFKWHPESVLDVGCGHGLDAKWLHGKSLRYVGVDPCPENLDLARRDVPGADFRVGFMQELPFADGEFEWVYSSGVRDVLPTVADMALAIAECLRVASWRVYSLEATAHPRALTERYGMVPMYYGLSYRRVNYHADKDKADCLWCIDKSGFERGA